MTEEIINAIIAGIGSDDDPTQQALAIVDNLGRHGYVIAAQQDGVREAAKPLRTGIEAARVVEDYLNLRGYYDPGDAANIIHILNEEGFLRHRGSGEQKE